MIYVNGIPNRHYHDSATKHKQEVDWLQAYPQVLTMPGLQDLSNAYKQFLKKTRGFPNFKSKHKSKKSFAVDITNQLKEEGYFKFNYTPTKKGNLKAKLIGTKQLKRYSNPIPKSGRIFEGRKGKRYLTIQYEVDAITRQATIDPIGIDRNAGQCYGSNGVKYSLINLKSKQERIKFLQKWRDKKVKGSIRHNKLSFTI